LNNDLQKALGWAEPIIGPIQKISDKAWPTASYTKVFRLSTPKHDYYLKEHSLRGKYQQEKRAYQDWAIHLKNTAKLISFDDENMFLLLTAVSGRLVEGSNFSRKESLDIYFQAGRCLRALHAIKIIDTDKISIRQAYIKRLNAWLPRAKAMVAPKDIDWVRARVLEILPKLEDFERQPCHRDFTARNWLYQTGKLSLIDFEHSRPDFYLADLERLWGSIFIFDRELQESFFSAYGQLDDDSLQILERSTAMWALNTISWAYEHRDKVFEQHGREVLRRLQKQG